MTRSRQSGCITRDARIRTAVACALALALAACTPPPDQPTEKPTEPRATGLRDAVQAPLDSARETQQALDANAAAQRQAIEDAGG